MAREQVLVVPGRYKEIKRICEFIAAGAADAGFDANTIFHLELCCDEASTNIIEHAYGDEGVGDIAISYAVEDDGFTIVLRDTGQAFDPGDVPPPPAISGTAMPADELADQMRIGGLGLHFIRNLMDEVTYTADRRHGNRLVMVKKLHKDGDP
ncbi:MAG TPA: ATP-binding protein [Promineifilum sp.]|nr:ATP-binding protein [Promineifilum sp.]